MQEIQNLVAQKCELRKKYKMNKNQKEKFNCHNQRRRTASQKRKNIFNYTSMLTLLIMMIIVSGVSYVLVKNDLSVKGFVINDLHKQVNSLGNDNNDLEIELMSIESYKLLASRVEDLGMVKVDKIDYINTSDEYVAKR